MCPSISHTFHSCACAIEIVTWFSSSWETVVCLSLAFVNAAIPLVGCHSTSFTHKQTIYTICASLCTVYTPISKRHTIKPSKIKNSAWINNYARAMREWERETNEKRQIIQWTTKLIQQIFSGSVFSLYRKIVVCLVKCVMWCAVLCISNYFEILVIVEMCNCVRSSWDQDYHPPPGYSIRGENNWKSF